MKKVLLLALAVVLVCALFLLSGCGETTPAASGNGIVGSWTYPNTSYTYIFKEDGTGSYAGSPITYTTSGDKIAIYYDGSTIPFESTYSIEGNKLNVIDSLGNDTIYIKD